MCRNCQAAYKCIDGYYGDGYERKRRLEEDDFCYACIQNLVNAFLGLSKRHICEGDHCLLGYCDKACSILCPYER